MTTDTEVSQNTWDIVSLRKMKAVSYSLASLTASAPAEGAVLRGAVCKPPFSSEIPDRHGKVNVAQPARLLKAPSLNTLNKYIFAAIFVSWEVFNILKQGKPASPGHVSRLCARQAACHWHGQEIGASRLWWLRPFQSRHHLWGCRVACRIASVQSWLLSYWGSSGIGFQRTH